MATASEQLANGDHHPINEGILYRGHILDSHLQEEFAARAVLGGEHPVYWLDGEEAAFEEVDSPIAIEDLPYDELREEWVTVTGGFTEDIGTAINFGTKSGHLPGTFYFDASEIDVETFRVEYDREFMDEHPGLLVHIDTLAGAEVRLNEDLWGIAYDPEPTAPIMAWGEERMAGRASSISYQDEAEVVCICHEIPFDRAMLGGVAWYIDAGGSPFDPRTTLLEQPGYQRRAMGRDDVVAVDHMDYREMIVELHELWAASVNRTVDPFYSVVLEERVNKGMGTVDVDDISVVYNGHEFIPPEDLPDVFRGA